jgi:hypothetical protein
MLYENKTCCLRDCWEEMRCVLMASKMVDDWQKFPSTSIIWISYMYLNKFCNRYECELY